MILFSKKIDDCRDQVTFYSDNLAVAHNWNKLLICENPLYLNRFYVVWITPVLCLVLDMFTLKIYIFL